MALQESLLDHHIGPVNILPEGSNSTGSYTFRELFGCYMEANREIESKMSPFWDKVAKKYSPDQQKYIERAVIIATVAHQYNWNTEKRYRKEADPQTGKPIPYIYHPLEMAERLVDDGFGWLPVVAILLHDVPEDADLGEGLDMSNTWLSVLRNEFVDTGKAELLSDLIEGMTEKSLPDRYTIEGKEIRDRLSRTPLFKMIDAYVTNGRLKGKVKLQHVSDYEKEAIYEVTYNLEDLFASALKSPENLQLFILKIVDIWHNFQSPEWIRSAKILRGRLAASIAEWMGWYPMRSDLIYLLSQVADTTSPYAPEIEGEYLPGESEKDLAIYENWAREIMTRFKAHKVCAFDMYKMFAGRPIAYVDNNFPHWQETTLPPPEIIMTVDRNNLMNLVQHRDKPRESYASAYRYRREFSAVPLFSVSNPQAKKGYSSGSAIFLPFLTASNLVETFGRLRVDLSISIANYSSFNFRFESDEPYLIDYFRNPTVGKPAVEFLKIPEARGLFHQRLMGREMQDRHIASLIGFLYEPNMSISLGEYTFAVFFAGSLCFVDGHMKFRDLRDILRIGEPLRYVYDFDGNSCEVADENTLGSFTEGAARRKDLKSRIIFLS